MSIPSQVSSAHVQEATASSMSSSSSGETLFEFSKTDTNHPQLREAVDAGAPFHDVIPPDHAARTLVLCFDGTGDQFDADNSNVVQLFSMLKKGDRTQQMVYYQAGIGTYTVPQVATPLMASLSKTLDMMIAWNMDAHVMGGYEFLMENYEAGDKICIFGFSRGAYTARALAGMIHKVGLLPACNHQQIPFAYKMFTRTDEVGWQQSTAFKKAFSMDVDIEFIGVWDTVRSVGLIPRTLPFTSSNSSIRTFRHAVSLDERRAKFKANHYNKPTDPELKLGTQPGDMPKTITKSSHRPTLKPRKKSQMESEQEFSQTQVVNLETDVLEVWFAGVHCDVGGGSVPNDSKHNLARIPLRWMIRQCFLANTGIRFHSELLRTIGLDPTKLHPDVHIARPPALQAPTDTALVASTDKLVEALAPDGRTLTEEEEDLVDALCPIYDMLDLAKYWWALEVIPLEHRYQNKDGEWKAHTTVNMGQGRVVIPEVDLKMHRTVKTRMEAMGLQGGRYTPMAKYTQEPVWVD
ncbi:hypothetical protein B0H21DRAFT_92677 [Amylocystis lapponica]|nr:hypothetical protein B0H21DRAFT_92677 [Amylocystis lapponica]